MNQQNVAKREVLDYKQFLGKVHDNTYKPLSPAHQSEGGLEKSGLSQIKREPAYDFVGYVDSVFNHQSKIDSTGFRISIDGKAGMMDAAAPGGVSSFGTNESLDTENLIKRLNDFE